MRRPEPLPPELSAAPFTVELGSALGITRGRMRAHDLSTPFRGVRVLEAPRSLLDLCRSYAVRMPEGQYFSHTTAAHLLGIPLPHSQPAGLPLHVSVAAPGRQPRMRGIVGHRGQADAIVWLLDGLPTSAPCETWCSLGVILARDDLIAAGDRLVGWPSPLSSLEQIDDSIRRFGTRHGARALAAARREVRAGSASPRESLLRLTVLRAGFPSPEPNGPIRLTSGRRTHGDLVFRRYRVLLEYDGDQHRTLDRQFHTDVDRLNDLAHDGWLVIRVHRRTTVAEVTSRLDRALRLRGWRP